MVYEKLQKFLINYPKKVKHTHTIYGDGDMPGGSYTIPPDKMDDLHRLLSRSLFDKGDSISIVEKVQNITRLVIDLDFKYKNSIETRQYNENVLILFFLIISLKSFYLIYSLLFLYWIYKNNDR